MLGFQKDLLLHFLKSWKACTLTLVDLYCKCGNIALKRVNSLQENLIAAWQTFSFSREQTEAL